MTLQSALYVGLVRHHRFRPRPHALAYRVFWMLLDLDEIDQVSAKLRFFSRNRFNLYAFRDADYGDRSGRPLRLQIEETLAKAGIAHDSGPIRLLTMPRILGYAFNPLSTYFCYRRDGSLCATVYEVHNTFGEIHSRIAGCGAYRCYCGRRADAAGRPTSTWWPCAELDGGSEDAVPTGTFGLRSKATVRIREAVLLLAGKEREQPDPSGVGTAPSYEDQQ
ncbi:hypothetical protein BTHI11S_06252 [Bosea thiooxidans]